MIPDTPLTAQPLSPEEPVEPSRGSICKCGLAKSYHPRLADHEYQPRYPARRRAPERREDGLSPEELRAEVEIARRAVVQASIHLANKDLPGAHEDIVVALDALIALSRPLAGSQQQGPGLDVALLDVLANRASPPEYPGMALVPVHLLDKLATAEDRRSRATAEYEAWKANPESPCNQCGGGKGLGHTPDCPRAATIRRLRTRSRVAAHSPHDQLGEPIEGFPVCSACGAIQTDAALPAATEPADGLRLDDVKGALPC